MQNSTKIENDFEVNPNCSQNGEPQLKLIEFEDVQNDIKLVSK